MNLKLKMMLTPILVLLASFSLAQEKTITGNVVDQSGLPLPGVSVLVVGTTIGTQTDFDGNYTINVNTGDVLRYSYVGQKTTELTVGGSSVIDVVLEEDAQSLEEVIVTGYTSQKKSEITGSVVKVDSKKLSQITSASVDQALQGNVSGLAISTTSGTPGSISDIRIRGISSITAGSSPLYVIDGVPVNSGSVTSDDAYGSMSALSGLDNNNIESITVLKDAASTAQYGARGSNGVILITTKSGKAGETKFQISSVYGFQNDAIKDVEMLTAANRFELQAEAYYNDGYFSTEQEAQDYLLTTDSWAEWDANGRPEGNWGDVVYNKDAPIQQHSISASGGGEGHTFFGSLGYLNQEGTTIGTSFERLSGSLNFTKDLTPRLKFSTNNSGTYSTQEAFLEGSAYFSSPRTAKFFMSPLQLPYNDDGTINEFSGSLPNPLYLVENDITENRFTRVVTNNSLNWQITDNLSYGTVFNVDFQLYNFRNYSNTEYGYGAATSGDATQYDRTNAYYVIQNYVDYNLELSEDHVFDFKILQEYQANRYYFLGGSGESFADSGLYNLTSVGTPTSVTSSTSDWYVGAYLGLLKYSAFGGKYILDLSYRREGSSLFQEDNRWGDFWSVGGAWNISKEDFMYDVDFINNLKLRASYGVTGNSDIDENQYQSLIGYTSDYNGAGVAQWSNYGNDELSWEISKTLDIAVEFGLFQNVVSGSFGYFNRRSSDLLYDVPLSLTSGFSSQTQNLGALTNKGFEIDLNFNIINTDDIQFSMGGNLSTVKNRVTELPIDTNGAERTLTTTRTRIETGHAVTEWYMPTWAGVNSETGNEEWYINGVDGDTTTDYNSAESVFQGENGVPTITAGLNLNFRYKGVYLNASGYYSGGNKVYEGWHLYLNETNAYPLFAYNGYASLMDRWQEVGDEARNGKVTSSYSSWQSHSKYLHEGDFFRLRSLTFGYDLPLVAVQKLGMKKIDLFVRGNNLYTWVKDEYLQQDPEVDLDGVLGMETPPTRTISLGVNLNF